MIASARVSQGARRWTAMSSGKSNGQRRSDIDWIGPGTLAASSSSAPEAVRQAGSAVMGDLLDRVRERPGAQTPGGVAPGERHDLEEPQLGQTDQGLIGVCLD